VKFRGSNLIFSNDFFGEGVNTKEELFDKILLANVEIPKILVGILSPFFQLMQILNQTWVGGMLLN
jgi:hypothetical protein